MTNLQIERAIISVWDKTGIVPLAKALRERGVEIYSTGGTFKALQEAGLEPQRIEALTQFPEILGGRVKTLHPMVFSGILADLHNPQHRENLESVGGRAFQLIIVNLYPFAETLRSGESDPQKLIEMIDIGGPSMLRAAAKNFKNVAMLCNPAQYREFLERLMKDELDLAYRESLARDVFIRTTTYDAEIANYFCRPTGQKLPEMLLSAHRRQQILRYGENPDQEAAIYAPVNNPDWSPFSKLQGKEISYNNYIDALAAYQVVRDYRETVCAIIKHTNPCGFGLGRDPLEAYQRAVKTDPVSYFGGIVALNRPVDTELAAELTQSFLECVIAPDFTAEALAILGRKKNLRLMQPNPAALDTGLDIKGYADGILVQTVQTPDEDSSLWQIVTQKEPDAADLEALKMGWKLIRHVKSNSILLVDQKGAVGVGAGQMSRVDSLKISLRKAREAGLAVQATLMISDAYFPFRDSIDLAAQHGIRGVIQPGGSIRDKEVIQACDEHGLFMVMTGKRVFKH